MRNRQEYDINVAPTKNNSVELATDINTIVDVATDSESKTLDLVTSAKIVVEMAVVPETPNVQYNQQLYIHAPTTSYDSPGIASFSDSHFRIINGKVFLANTISRETIIVHVNSLPTENIDDNCIYVVGDQFYVYINEYNKFVRIDSTIVDITNTNNILNDGKIYRLNNKYYVRNANNTIDYLVLNSDISSIDTSFIDSLFEEG